MIGLTCFSLEVEAGCKGELPRRHNAVSRRGTFIVELNRQQIAVLG
jgi:hypothetical protein